MDGRLKCSRVYPRVCGGTKARKWLETAKQGLSPRVRGNLWQMFRTQLEKGSIPACAGEPEHGRAYLPLGTVYPRVCGGTFKM